MRPSAIAPFLLFLAGFLQFAPAQPLVFVGQADAEVSGAISYELFQNPLARPFDYGRADLNINLPVNLSAPLHDHVQIPDSTFVVPEFFGRIRQQINGTMDVSVPLFGGIGFFSLRENANLSISGTIGDALISIDSTLEDMGTVKLKGSMRLPLHFRMGWRSLTFGYAIEPNPFVRIAFQVHKHTVSATTAGQLRPDITGRITIQSEAAGTDLDILYPDTKLSGFAQGHYQGSAWSPELAVGVGGFTLVSRMGAHLVAKGGLKSRYTVPFFIDERSLQMRFTEPDSFLAAHNLKRILNSDVSEASYNITDDMVFNLPQSHSLIWDIDGGRYQLAYTKVFGKLESYTLADSTGSDSTQIATGSYLNAALLPDHVVLATVHWGWFYTQLGAFTMNAGYRDDEALLTGLSPLETGGAPWVPVFNFGFEWGRAIGISTDFFVLPVPALRSGLVYAF